MRVASFSAAALAAGLLAFGAAPQASAATVVGAASIVITNPLPDYLQIAEVIADNFSSVDVALAANGATATASSVFTSATPGHAIDGIFPADYPDMYISATPFAGEFLRIDLASPATLASLTIYGRDGCCSGRDLFNYEIFNSDNLLLASGQLDARLGNDNPNDFATVKFDAPRGDGVPEPAAWALLIAGFGLAGEALRRRKAAASCG
jgi:hypothetical protein